MFRYINMPKLVAHYLKEFSVRTDGTPSVLYKFVFCSCLPFVSNTFNTARLIALGISECTPSSDQIVRLLFKITGANVTFEENLDDYYCGYDDTNDATCTDFVYSGAVPATDASMVFYNPVPNEGNMIVDLNGYSREQFESYLSLILPFYTNFKITYV